MEVRPGTIKHVTGKGRWGHCDPETCGQITTSDKVEKATSPNPTRPTRPTRKPTLPPSCRERSRDSNGEYCLTVQAGKTPCPKELLTFFLPYNGGLWQNPSQALRLPVQLPRRQTPQLHRLRPRRPSLVFHKGRLHRGPHKGELGTLQLQQNAAAAAETRVQVRKQSVKGGVTRDISCTPFQVSQVEFGQSHPRIRDVRSFPQGRDLWQKQGLRVHCG